MIDDHAFAAAFILWAGAILSPGPALAAIIHSAVTRPRKESMALVVGITVGSALYGGLTLFWLVWFMDQATAWRDALRLAGAGYLVWLGIEAWRTGGGPRELSLASTDNNRLSLLRGLLLELSNPKGIAFFVSVFVVAIPSHATIATKAAILGSGLAFELAWYSIVVLAFSASALRGGYSRWQGWITKAFGLMFVSFGLALLLTPHA